MDNNAITHATFKQLVNDGVIRSVSAVAQGGQWELSVEYGRVQKYLKSTNGQNRRSWSKLDTVQSYLADLGVRQFSVDAAGFLPGRGGVKRPDRTVALQKLYKGN
ncbi:MAG: hypothetical protein PSN44_06275 [Gammaproteobacteria bacterium]|nr:hypothetical protein [Gammaproteobacteria bacterium]